MNTSQIPANKKIINAPNIVGLILCILALTGALRVALSSPMAADSWLHLATGRFVVENKRVPTHIDISAKKVEPVLEWVAQSWLADTLLYLAADANKQLGSTLLLTFFLLVSLSVSYGIGGTLQVRTNVGIVGIFVGSLLVLPFWKLHPFSMLPLLTLGLIDGYVRWKKTRRLQSLVFIPIILYLWANIAGGFLFIPVYLIIGMGITEWLMYARSPQKHTVWQFIAAITSGILVTLFTPHGIRIWIYNITVYGLLDTRKWYSTLAGALEAANTSNIKFAPSSFLFVIALAYMLYVVFIVAYLLSAHYKRTIKQIAPLLFILPMLVLPLIWIRLIPLALLTTLPLFLVSTDILLDIVSLDSQKKRIGQGILWATGALVVGILWISPPITFPNRPPKEQFDLISTHVLSKQIMVSTDIAGYAYYRLYPTRGFIDAQDDLYDEHDAIAIFSGYSGVSEASIQELTKAYDFATLLVSKENDYLTGYFSTHPDWVMAYLDYNGILFVKRDSANDDFIRAFGLPSLDLSVNLGVKKDATKTAIVELTGFINKFPNSTLAVGQLATLYRATNQLEQAETTLNRIPQSRWDYIVMTEMGRIKAAQGLCKQSETWFLNALNQRNEKNVSKTTFDLAILYAVCFNDEEKAKHYFKRYTSYPIPGFERERATEVMKKYVSTLEE